MKGFIGGFVLGGFGLHTLEAIDRAMAGNNWALPLAAIYILMLILGAAQLFSSPTQGSDANG